MTRKFLLLSGLLVALAPAPFLLPGCGGGSGGPSDSTRTAIGTVNLSATQTGTLSLTIQNNNTVTGNLVVNEPPAAFRKTQDFTFVIPAATYPITGTFTSPDNFSVSGTFPAPIGAFTITGTLPNQPSGSGTYTITANGQITTGTFGIPITPAPTVTPTSSGDEIDLTYSNLAGTNVNVESGAIPQTSGQVALSVPLATGVYDEGALATLPSRFATVDLRLPITVGRVITIGPGTTSKFSYGERTSAATNPVHNWAATGGSIRIDTATALSNNRTRVTYTLQNLVLQPAPNQTGATGSFILNGTGQMTGGTTEAG